MIPDVNILNYLFLFQVKLNMSHMPSGFPTRLDTLYGAV